MSTRSLFNRNYTSYTPGGTQVWLVNGTGVTTSLASSKSFTAGVNLAQGDVVYVSGTYVFPASAASGVSPSQYNAIGITAASALASAAVNVILNDNADISSSNITAASSLTPGSYYYLSAYSGQLTEYSTASGVITVASGYSALVPLGIAVSTSVLKVEIEPPTVLFS